MTKIEEIIAAAEDIVKDDVFVSRADNIPGQHDSYGISGHKLRRLKKALEKDSANCECKGWGCWECCTSVEEICAKQGTFR